MPSADQVPIKLAHLTMPRPKWVVLIAGSTGSALRAVRPPNLHITPVVRRDLVYAASATGSLYRSPVAIMAQTVRASLLASAIWRGSLSLFKVTVWIQERQRRPSVRVRAASGSSGSHRSSWQG